MADAIPGKEHDLYVQPGVDRRKRVVRITCAVWFAEPTFKLAESMRRPVTVGFWSRLEVLAQLHLTYILAQSEDALFIVDQHAAHERVAFESLMSAFRGGHIDRQIFLIPLSLDLPADQCEALLTQKSELLKMGLEIELGGPQSVLINSAPILLKDSAVVESLQKLAVQILELGGGFVIEKKIIDICASMACHSVVRAGQSLSHEEMRSLLQMMDKYPMSGFCPHGRPVHIQMPIAKIEKDFGRTL